MNDALQGTLFSGNHLAVTPVSLTIRAGRLQSHESPPRVDACVADVRTSDRLANVPRFIYLPDGMTVETSDNETVDRWLSSQRRGRVVATVHALETHSRFAAIATVLVVVTVASLVWYGLPVVALRTAMAVPASVELEAGKAGQVALSRVLQPSSLGSNERHRVEIQLERVLRAGGLAGSPQLVFHSMGGKFPNAFALPGGIIVVTDELVKLPVTDEEIAAVLAHEIGHWQRRHGLQSILRSSSALLLVSTVTGDLSALTTFAGTLPFVLLQRGYSREFEAEADDYAVQLLNRAKIDPRYFETILKKLDASRPTVGGDFTYLGTHPGTGERINRVNRAAQSLGWNGPLPESPPAVPPAGQSLSLTPPSSASPLAANTVEVPPRALHRVAPSYPFDLRSAHISGTVVVEFVIDENGDVMGATVVRSTHAGFEPAALAAVSQWKFSPGKKNGRDVRVSASQLLEFNADE